MSFRDQLKGWKDSHEVPEQGERERRAAEAKAAEEKQRAEAEAQAREAAVSDEDLFLQAVEGIEPGEATLRKYDRADPTGEERAKARAEEAAQPKDVRDKALFLQFVEEMGIDKKE